MKNPATLPTWAPRVKPYLIRRLYESDAQGFSDVELLDKVGWTLYSRCESFLLACEATQGRARCPVCESVVLHGHRSKEILHCTSCGWECSWREYSETIKDQQLSGGMEVIALFMLYIEEFLKAKETTEKMMLIDGLIHGFHHFLRSGRTRRPVGVNLIDGNLDFVVDFLDHLSYGPGSTPSLQQTFDQWREKINQPSIRKRKPKGKE